MKKSYLLILALALLIAICGFCLWMGFFPHDRLSPSGRIPDRDIVFSIAPGMIGFVNADGSDMQTRTVTLSDGALIHAYHWASPTLDREITWSPDGRYLVAKAALHYSGSGSPILIATTGEFLRCSFKDSNPFGPGRFWLISETEVLAVDSGSGQAPSRVLVFDVQECVIQSTLYQGASEDENILSAALSFTGMLAISRNMPDQGKEILVYQPNSSQAWTVSGGEWPAWSPDGQWLAYSVQEDGLYVVRQDGSQARKLVANRMVSSPSWSPDGEWLVYNRVPGVDTGGGIYKIQVATGAEYRILDKGEYPNWRWTHDADE